MAYFLVGCSEVMNGTSLVEAFTNLFKTASVSILSLVGFYTTYGRRIFEQEDA